MTKHGSIAFLIAILIVLFSGPAFAGTIDETGKYNSTRKPYVVKAKYRKKCTDQKDCRSSSKKIENEKKENRAPAHRRARPQM